MKNTKKIGVLISLILISIIALGAVAAADDVAVDDADVAAVEEVVVDDAPATNEIIESVDDTDVADLQDSSEDTDDVVADEAVSPKNNVSLLINSSEPLSFLLVNKSDVLPEIICAAPSAFALCKSTITINKIDTISNAFSISIPLP